MANESNHDSTMEDFAKMLKDKEFRQFFYLSPLEESVGNATESICSIVTTSDALNTVFVDNSPTNQYQQQSQTTEETSSTVHDLIKRIIEQEHEIINLHTPTKTNTTSIGTIPKTPIIIDLVSPTIETIDLYSPHTPASTGSGASPNSTPNLPPQ